MACTLRLSYLFYFSLLIAWFFVSGAFLLIPLLSSAFYTYLVSSLLSLFLRFHFKHYCRKLEISRLTGAFMAANLGSIKVV